MRTFLNIVAASVLAITSLWSFFLCLIIIIQAAGFWGLVGAVIFSPIVYFVAPFYSGIAWHNWTALIVQYGGFLLAFLLRLIATTMPRVRIDD